MLKYLLLVYLLTPFLYAQEIGIVTDTKQHLQWQDNVEAEEKKWKLAKGYCQQLTLAGVHDWRLATQKELFTLAKSESLKKKFRFLEEEIYWSSETDKKESLNAMTVFTGNGFTSSSDKCDKNFIICVRGFKK